MVGMRKGHYLASEKCPLNRAGRVRVLSHLSKPRDNPLVSSVVSALAAFPEIEGSTLLVCVSGGLDSVALLRLLLAAQQQQQQQQQRQRQQLQRQQQRGRAPRHKGPNATHAPPSFRLEVLHFNHGIRPESAEEATFVGALAATHGLPFHLREAPPDQAARWRDPGGGGCGTGLQETARKWRRAEAADVLHHCLGSGGSGSGSSGCSGCSGCSGSSGSGSSMGVSGDKDAEVLAAAAAAAAAKEQVVMGEVAGAAFVVTAHHADDQAETVLLKLLRGVHLSRVTGMEALSGAPNEHGARTFRPLVAAGVRKAELEAFLGQLGQAWREDPSNADGAKYKRNAVRLSLVPLLAELAGGPGALAERLAAATAQSSQLRAWLEAEAEAWEAAHLVGECAPVPLSPSPSPPALLPLGPWYGCAPPLRTELLHRALVRGAPGCSVPYAHISRVEAQLGVSTPPPSSSTYSSSPSPVAVAAAARLQKPPAVDRGKGPSLSHPPISRERRPPRRHWTLELPRGVRVQRAGDVLRCGLEKQLPNSDDETPA